LSAKVREKGCKTMFDLKGIRDEGKRKKQKHQAGKKKREKLKKGVSAWRIGMTRQAYASEGIERQDQRNEKNWIYK